MSLPFRTAVDVEAAVEPVRRHLEGDGLLGYPTETVYGLGSTPTDTGVDALAGLKGRPRGKPFLLLIAGRSMAEHFGLRFSAAAQAMAQAYWPGPLTLVLPGGDGLLPDRLRGPEGGIAVRHTSHEGMGHLIGRLGFPVTSTSANQPGGPTAPGAAGITRLFGSAVASGRLLVLDGGVLGNVPPSTIIDCTRPAATLVREGAVPRDDLRRSVGRLAP